MVDKNVVTPLHVQVTNELRKEILAKNYGENGCIGTHTQLAERFGVSLRTIRTAVQQLSDEGLVDIRQGKGTFVRRTMFVDPLKDLTGISNMLSQMQVDRESVVPVLEHIETPAWIAQSIRPAARRDLRLHPPQRHCRRCTDRECGYVSARKISGLF